MNKIKGKTYFLDQVINMPTSDIESLKINRIVITSNHDKEFYFEKDIIKDIPCSFMQAVCYGVEAIHNNTGENPDYYKAASEDYELYEFQP